MVLTHIARWGHNLLLVALGLLTVGIVVAFA
jgi:hypothetical protein